MKYILFLAFFCCSGALASEVVLDRVNKQGFRKIDVLKKENGVYYFDGQNLGKRLPAAVESAWSSVSKGPAPHGKQACFFGTFKHISRTGKTVKIRKGCAEGKTYGALIRDLEVVRKHARQMNYEK